MQMNFCNCRKKNVLKWFTTCFKTNALTSCKKKICKTVSLYKYFSRPLLQNIYSWEKHFWWRYHIKKQNEWFFWISFWVSKAQNMNILKALVWNITAALGLRRKGHKWKCPHSMFPQHVYRGIYSENVSPRGNDSKPPLLYQIYEEPNLNFCLMFLISGEKIFWRG